MGKDGKDVGHGVVLWPSVCWRNPGWKLTPPSQLHQKCAGPESKAPLLRKSPHQHPWVLAACLSLWQPRGTVPGLKELSLLWGHGGEHKVKTASELCKHNNIGVCVEGTLPHSGPVQEGWWWYKSQGIQEVGGQSRFRASGWTVGVAWKLPLYNLRVLECWAAELGKSSAHEPLRRNWVTPWDSWAGVKP